MFADVQPGVRVVDPLVQANPDLDRGLQLASVRATLPAFFPADRTRPWGWMDFGTWATFGRWMQDQGLLKQPPATAKAMTTEFLPGEGLQPQDATPGA